MTRPILITALVGSFGLAACQFIPGTSAYQEAKAREAVARMLIDPDSAQFRNVESRDETICGEVNGKNRMGAYIGYVRFYVVSTNWRVTLDPQFDPANLASARSLCSLSRYDSASCTRQMEEEVNQAAQAAFDTYWDAHCGTRQAPQSRTPFDPTRSNALDDLNLVAENAAIAVPPPPEDTPPAINEAMRAPRSRLDSGNLQQILNEVDEGEE